MPKGTAIETTRSIARDVEGFIARALMKDDEQTSEGIISWATWIGEGAPRYTLAIDPGSNDPGSISILILLLLVAQFNSLRKPIMILLTIPLGLVGVTYGLLIAGSIFGFFTILGLIFLSDIVINNAIVLLDRINIEIDENGLSLQATTKTYSTHYRHHNRRHAATMDQSRSDV